MKHCIIICLAVVLSVFPSFIHAQQKTILKGLVTDKATGRPLAGAIVSIRLEGSNKIIQFSRTSAQGAYEVQLDTIPIDSRIHISMMGYAPQAMPIKQSVTRYNVQMEERETALKEVIIKAPNIRQRGDTVSYNVAGFATAGDKSLADVLKKMPGIEIADNGEIKYNGTAINKFYIEGHDMLGGSYGLATNNIHHEDVGTVEIMERHEPIKALEDISFSQNPAINIRLKESAKRRLVGTMKVGGGVSPHLWETEATFMRFSKKNQWLSTLKSNNTGENVMEEHTPIFTGNPTDRFTKTYQLEDYIAPTPDRLDDLDEGRVRQNQSHAATINALWSIGRYTDLSALVSYGHDRLASHTQSATSYLLADSTIIIDESEDAKTHNHQLSATLTLTANAPTHYLHNQLTTDVNWRDIDITTGGTYPNIQSASMPHYTLSDHFELLRRHDNKTYTFNSYNSLLSKTNHLFIHRKDGICEQHVHSSAFYSHTNTSLGFSFRPMTIWVKAGFTAMSRTMNSEAIGLATKTLPTSNDICVTTLNLYAMPVVEFKLRGWEAKWEMPIAYAPYFYTNHLDNEHVNRQKFIASPRLYVKYFFTTAFSMSLTGQIAQTPIEEKNFYEGVIIKDYYQLTTGLVDYRTGHRKSLSLNVAYKKPLHTFFSNITVGRSWLKSSHTTARSFTADYVLLSLLPQSSNGDVWMVQGNISKGISFLKGKVAISSSYVNANGQLYQNGMPSAFSSDTWVTTLKFHASLTPHFNIAYGINYEQDGITLRETQTSLSTHRLSQHITAKMKIDNHWLVTLAGEHYENKNTTHERSHLFLADTSIAYSMKSGWELSMAVRNLFNQREYARNSYTKLASIDKTYAIRGRNVIASAFFHF